MTINNFFLLHPDLKNSDSSVEKLQFALLHMNEFELLGIVIDSNLDLLSKVRDVVADFMLKQRTVN